MHRIDGVFDAGDELSRALGRLDGRETPDRSLDHGVVRPLDDSGEYTRVIWSEIDFDVDEIQGFWRHPPLSPEAALALAESMGVPAARIHALPEPGLRRPVHVVTRRRARQRPSVATSRADRPCRHAPRRRPTSHRAPRPGSTTTGCARTAASSSGRGPTSRGSGSAWRGR